MPNKELREQIAKIAMENLRIFQGQPVGLDVIAQAIAIDVVAMIEKNPPTK